MNVMESSQSDNSPSVTNTVNKDIQEIKCIEVGTLDQVTGKPESSIVTDNEDLDDIFLTNLGSSDLENKAVEETKLDTEPSIREPGKMDLTDRQTASNESTNLPSENGDTHIAEVSVVNEISNVPKENKETETNKGYRSKLDSWSDDDEDSTSSSDTSSDSDFCQIMIESSAPKKLPLIKTKGELGMDELPVIEELVITAKEEEMALIGKIHAIVEKLIVVVAIKESKPLDLDSVLFLSHDKPLGRVFDVFGPVIEPFYCVRFNSIEDIKNKEIEIGADVFFVPDKTDLTSYVFLDELQKQKGSDASWKHNNEPPEEFLDFSDDEAEKAAKRKRVARNRNRQFNNSEVASKRPALTDASSLQSNFSSRASSPDVIYSGQFPRHNPFSSTPVPSQSPAPSLHSLLSASVRAPSMCNVSTPQIVFAPPQVSFPQQGLLQRPSSPLVFTSFPPPPLGFGQVSLVNALPTSISSPAAVHSPFVNNFQNIIPGSQLSITPQNYFNQRFAINHPPISQAMYVTGNSQMHLHSSFPTSPSPLSQPPFVPRSSHVQLHQGFQGPVPVSLQQSSRPNTWHPVIRFPNPPPILPLNVQIPHQNAQPLTMNPFQSNGVPLQPFVNNANMNSNNMPPGFY